MTGSRGAAGRHTALVLVGATALGAAVGTVAVAASPHLLFAYRAPDLRAVVETVNAVVALLVGYLVYGRYRQRHRLQDLLLVLALATVAVANLVLTAVPEALPLERGSALTQWAPLVVRLVGTALLTGAALTRTGRPLHPRAGGVLVLGLLTLLGALAIAAAVWGDLLPPAVDPRLVDDAERPSLVAHPAVLGVQVGGIALYATSAVAFARQADRDQDELIRWVAAGCVLASFARVHYLLFPSLYTEYLYTGDLLRSGFYAFMLVGAAREITTYWQARARTAVLEDRRRLARDLHDGLIQELSYIGAQSRRLATRPGDPVTVGRIADAAGRAVDEARRALAALTREDEEPLPALLQAAVDEMAGRYDVSIATSLDPRAEADGPLSEALLRITAEAVRNAVRHGAAELVELRLTAEPLCLAVIDDGRGFDPSSGRPGGFGLTSMRERAEAMGAEFAVTSEPGDGTTVRVTWP